MRLIDADAYRDEFMNGVYDELADDSDNYRANRIIDLFDNAPTIDAVPVVHGEWRRHKKGGIYCSACKHDNHCGDIRLIMGYVQKFPICPWCGAKMDKKGECR